MTDPEVVRLAEQFRLAMEGEQAAKAEAARLRDALEHLRDLAEAGDTRLFRYIGIASNALRRDA